MNQSICLFKYRDLEIIDIHFSDLNTICNPLKLKSVTNVFWFDIVLL